MFPDLLVSVSICDVHLRCVGKGQQAINEENGSFHASGGSVYGGCS